MKHCSSCHRSFVPNSDSVTILIVPDETDPIIGVGCLSVCNADCFISMCDKLKKTAQEAVAEIEAEKQSTPEGEFS